MDDIDDYLSELRGSKVYYKPNPGNAGDSLIAHATYQLFEKHQIQYSLIERPENEITYPEDKILIYGGGGNFVEYYLQAANFTRYTHQKAKKLIILPHTINENEKLLASLGKNVDIICREKKSFEHVKKHAKKSNVYLMNDLAFNIDVKKTILDGKSIFRKRKNTERFLFRNIKRKTRISIQSLKTLFNTETIDSYRTDIAEKTDLKIPKTNIDLSQAFAADAMDELASHDAAYKLFGYLCKFDTVNTNRLHICIAGILLNKKVRFFPNRYWKNQMVYEFSMKDTFTNVEWVSA